MSRAANTRTSKTGAAAKGATAKGSGLRRLRLGRGVWRFIGLIVFTGVTAAIGMVQVSSRYELVRYGYAIDQDLFEYRQLQEANKRLTLYRAATLDPNQVRVRAEDQLGMHVPGAGDELFVPTPGSDAHQTALNPINPMATREVSP